MPIRLNLLAEAQAMEELRRRDPVKRAIWIGVLLVAAMLVWSSSFWVKSMMVKNELAQIETSINSRTNEHQHIRENKGKLALARRNLSALEQLNTNRFLNGTMLNALQQTTVDNVQLTRLKMLQEFAVTPETKGSTNNNRVTPGKPATSTERKTLSLWGKDYNRSAAVSAGQNLGWSQYKQAISEVPYFQQVLNKTNEFRLRDLTPPQTDATGRSFVIFWLECRHPDRMR